MKDERVRRERRIEFLGEQSGKPEDELKALLRNVFRRHHRVTRAYLAVVGFAPTAQRAVALCIAPAGAESRALVDGIELEFARLFAGDADLDIIFVDQQQEEDLMRVCQPFYPK